jgi:nicotinate-nucleotide pyrophosphorylase (carboxylating)
VLKVKQAAVLAGVEIAQKIFHFNAPSAVIITYFKDGDEVRPGDIVFDIEAHVHTILQCERVVLNTMQRMSGIASLTRQYADAVKDYPVKILDTRKTTPGLKVGIWQFFENGKLESEDNYDQPNRIKSKRNK